MGGDQSAMGQKTSGDMTPVAGIKLGAPQECGTFCLGAEEIINFARVFDPQPYHLDEAIAAKSIFAGLTASSLHTGAAATCLVLKTVMGKLPYIGSPGAPQFQLLKPVRAGVRMTVTQEFCDVTETAGFPELLKLTGITRVFDDLGELAASLTLISYVSSGHVDAAKLSRQSEELSSPDGPVLDDLGPFPPPVTFETSSPVPDDGRIYFDDCHPGMSFSSDWGTVSDAEVNRFYESFNGTGPIGSNRFINLGIASSQLTASFQSRFETVAGGEMTDVRWPTPIVTGNLYRSKITVTGARELKTRPDRGLINAQFLCVDRQQRLVSSFHAKVIIRKRSG